MKQFEIDKATPSQLIIMSPMLIDQPNLESCPIYHHNIYAPKISFISL